MRTNIVQIGNREGVVLPSDLLQKMHLSLKSPVNILWDNRQIVIRAQPRQGWAAAFEQFALSGEEETFFPDVFDDEDLSALPWEQKQ